MVMAWKVLGSAAGRTRRAGVLAATVVSAGVLAAGCSGGSGGPGASSSSPATSSSPASASAAGQAVAYAACMRSHGVPKFPDPTVQNGSVGFSITPGDGVDPSSPQYKAALTACSSLRGGGTSNAGSSAQLAQKLKFAKCMRSHGVPDFPDPNSKGGFSGTSSVSPQSATFQNAQSTCMKLTGMTSGSASS
jgi:hypothetical protein